MGHADLGFEELCELSRSGALQADGTALRPPPAASPAVTSDIAPSSGDATSSLVQALPEGSDARRAAVAALGHEVHARMLRVNVMPSSALLAAAILPAALVPGDTPVDMLVRCVAEAYVLRALPSIDRSAVCT